MTIETRKYKLIKEITDLDDEHLIIQLEQLIEKSNKLKLMDHSLSLLAVSIDDDLDIEQLITEQNFTNPTKEELDEIIRKADVTEPIDELLEMI